LDDSIFLESVRVAGLGMALVFLALGALLVAIVLLGRIFPGSNDNVEVAEKTPLPETASVVAARAAAIGLALAQSSLPSRTPPAPGWDQQPATASWLDHGRRHQMARRRLP
jgi:Na+-transporting methylmalonyl-CoA/oxaloacetate decarboxylase gamma subunit